MLVKRRGEVEPLPCLVLRHGVHAHLQREVECDTVDLNAVLFVLHRVVPILHAAVTTRRALKTKKLKIEHPQSIGNVNVD